MDAKSQENDEKESSPVQGPPPSIAYAIIGWMARAMVEMGAVQATKGLQKWMKKVYKIEADWLEGAVHMASSRFDFVFKEAIYILDWRTHSFLSIRLCWKTLCLTRREH